MKLKRKCFAMLISICLIVSLIPSVVFAEGESDSEKTIMMGTSGVDKAEVIYFGNYTYKGNNYNLPWRVLDSYKTNMETDDGMFVISEQLIEQMDEFSSTFKSNGPFKMPDGMDYRGSIVQEWCDNFFKSSDNFSEKEKVAVLTTQKSDEEEILTDLSGGTWRSGGVTDILDNDKIFLISAREAMDYQVSMNPATLDYSGSTGGRWWLRSTNRSTFEDVQNGLCNRVAFDLPFVDGTRRGPVPYGMYPEGTFFVRPAMNFDTSRILFTSPASEGKQSGTLGAESLRLVAEYKPGENYFNPQTWKLTVLDNSRGGFKAKLAEGSEDRFIAGGTIKIDYSGAQTGTDEYISAMIVDEEGNVLYYGNLVNANEEGMEAGTAELKLPAELPVSTYTLKIFNEQKNGDYKTDYSSQLIDIPLTISDPAPVLKPVSGERSSLSKATVKFTASEDVTYYYAVVEKGDPAPTIDTDEEKGRCLAGEETISLTDLTTAGAKDIYIVGKDSGGNLSNVIKIEIPKYKASYIPSEPPHTHEFGEWTVVKEPTETETGLKEHSCKCGYKETEEIPMLTSSEPAKPEAPADTDGEKEIAGSDDRYSNGLAAERGEGESSNVPKTGDTGDMPYWFALLALSFAGLTITLRKTRREKSRR